jgi:hypothetical protein
MPGCDCEVSRLKGLKVLSQKLIPRKTMKFDLDSRNAGSTTRSAARPSRRSLTLAQKGLMTLGVAVASFVLAAPAQAQVAARQGAGAVCIGSCLPAVPISTTGTPTPASSTLPFDIIGAIQTFTVTTPGNLYSGGTIRVNGVNVLIPTNLVITLPAGYMTVGQLFAGSPVAGQSALALADLPAPIAAYEVTISGNIVGGVYRAGLVSIAQQSLNNGAGVIKAINTATGALCVGAAAGPCLPTDARVVVNDPSGRYGLANGVGGKANPDARFSVDADNPTIHASSGYPMCVPRVASPGIDARCPDTNRPSVGGIRMATYVMSPLAVVAGAPFDAVGILPCGALCNVNEQAPLVVGDAINYSGVLARDLTGIYVAAYAIEANVGIYTPPGGKYYMYMDAPLLGTGPAICPTNAECQARLRTLIKLTDPSGTRRPAIYAVDENLAGARTSRPLSGMLENTAQVGRWVFATDKDTLTFGGINGPGATRELVARVEGVVAGTPVVYGPANPALAAVGTANGLVAGQYVSPVGEFIFPEHNVGGGVMTPYNFRCLKFLATGWGQGGALPNIGKLTPFPEATTPAAVNCSF